MKDFSTDIAQLYSETNITFLVIKKDGTILYKEGAYAEQAYRIEDIVDRQSEERLYSVIESAEQSGITDIYLKSAREPEPYLLHYLKKDEVFLLFVPYPEAFTASVRTFMETNMALTKLYNEKAQLQKELQKKLEELRIQSITDPLTGLYNRQHLYEYIFQKVKNPVHWETLHFIMIDFNDFKKVNDEYGHKRGDWLLQFFAGIMKRHFQATFRFGGDEFVVVAADLEETAYINIMAKINEQFAKESEIASLSYGKIDLSKEQALMMTDEDHIDQFINIADKQMYQYKRAFKAGEQA